MLGKIILFILFISSVYSYEDHAQKKLIVVVGMHRSGTSLLSKGLQVLGVDFGDHLLPGAQDNPLGFHEDIDIGSFNETLLYLLKFSCDSIKNYPTDIPNKDILIRYGTRLIKNKTNKKELFGFKDPRTARNISLWKDIFQSLSKTEVQIVIIFRNPISVAQSLYNRNKIDLVRSYYLWLQYYVSVLLITNDFDTHFISYEDLVQNPYLEMKRLGTSLGLELNSRVKSQLKDFAKNYIDSSLQHYRNFTKKVDSQKDMPLEVKLLYKNFIKTSANKSDKIKLLKLSQKIDQRLREMDPLLRMIDKIENIGESRDYRFFGLLDELIKLYKDQQYIEKSITNR